MSDKNHKSCQGTTKPAHQASAPRKNTGQDIRDRSQSMRTYRFDGAAVIQHNKREFGKAQIARNVEQSRGAPCFQKTIRFKEFTAGV